MISRGLLVEVIFPERTHAIKSDLCERLRSQAQIDVSSRLHSDIFLGALALLSLSVHRAHGTASTSP